MDVDCVSLITSFSSVFVAVVTLIVTIIIGIEQIEQNNKMDGLTRSQIERDELRHEQDTIVQARSFIMKYHESIRLLPLCIAAAGYKNEAPYCREMFTAFDCLSNEVQSKILNMQNINLPQYEGDDFESDCYDALAAELKESFSTDYSFNQAYMYDGGKYLFRSIERYGNQSLSVVNDFGIRDDITDILCEQVRDHKISNAISKIATKYQVDSKDEKSCCEIITFVMAYVAIYESHESNFEFWIPTVDELTTMEDLYLWAMFSIYSNLYLSSKENYKKR